MAATVAFAVTACNKDQNGTLPTETDATVEDNQTIVEETENVFGFNDDQFGGLAGLRVAGIDSAGKPLGPKPKGDKCAKVTETNVNGVLTVVIDYGVPHDCDGKIVGGKMTITMPLKPEKNASGLFTQTIKYEDFQRGKRKMSGVHVVNLTLENGRPVLKESFSQSSITTEDGKTIVFNSSKTRKTDAKNTLKLDDDETSITGSTTATGSDGKSFKSLITRALLFKNACFKISAAFAVAGTTEIERNDQPKTTVDFGDGNCDRTYTVNGVTKTRK